MDQLNSTTQRQKGKHLSFEERVIIQTRLNDKHSPNKIAAELGCSPNTVRNEIKRGTVYLYNGKVARYKADAGQKAYEENRANSCRRCEYINKLEFIAHVENSFFELGLSIDACVGEAMEKGYFLREQMLCTKTIYNYIDKGLMRIRNYNLPEKVSRRPKLKRVRENKKLLGRSIEERPDIDDKLEFGHWEADLVIGQKTNNDEALLTLLERQTRKYILVKIDGKTASAVMDGFEKVRKYFGSKFSDVFKSITTDNGSEFTELSNLEKGSKTLVYYAHPYSSWEKGSNERHTRLVRRFIAKGERISDYGIDAIERIEDWCNNLPRKILGYKTPDELFEAKLDEIYSA